MNNKIINKFKIKDLRFTSPFPYSGIKNLCRNSIDSFQYSANIKGHKRLILYSGKKYNNFISTALNDTYDFILGLPWISKKDKNKFYSATDIYTNKEILTKKSYSSLMYSKWKDFINEVHNLSWKNMFRYYAYIDLENCYKHIYIHFINFLACEDDEKIQILKDPNSPETKKYLMKNIKLNHFHKEFMKNICFNSETNGLPLGNAISDFVCELLMLKIEHFVQIKFNNYNFKIIRFRDDFVIACNNKSKLNEIYTYLEEIILKLNMSINNQKSSKNIKFNKLYSLLSHENESIAFDNVDIDTFEIKSIKKFISKFPKSNKVFTLCKRLLKTNKEVKLDKIIKLLVRKSKTNIIPWVCALLDIKYDKIKIEKILKSSINFDLLSDSDKYWLFFLLEKQNIKNDMHEKILKFIQTNSPTLINNLQIDKLNFVKDADTFTIYSC